MKIVIDIDDEDYKRIQGISDVFNSLTSRAYSAIKNGSPLPEGAEILTKDAYSDLCRRAADVPDTNVGDLPSARPETHEKRTKTHACDCISRQAAIDTIGNVPDHDDGMVWEALSHAQRDVALLPSVEPERKSGKWLPHMVTAKCESIDRDVCSECRVCFYGEPTWSWKYCPKCGAPMEVNG